MCVGGEVWEEPHRQEGHSATMHALIQPSFKQMPARDSARARERESTHQRYRENPCRSCGIRERSRGLRGADVLTHTGAKQGSKEGTTTSIGGGAEHTWRYRTRGRERSLFLSRSRSKLPHHPTHNHHILPTTTSSSSSTSILSVVSISISISISRVVVRSLHDVT